MQLLHVSGCQKRSVAVNRAYPFVVHPSRSLTLLCLSDTVAGKKKNVNVGSKGGSAGLDDYKFDTPLDDADDFM